MILPPIHHGHAVQEPAKIHRARLNCGTWGFTSSLERFSCFRCFSDVIAGVLQAIPGFSAQGRAVSLGGRKYCGLFCWKDLPASAQESR